ncbi:hypothetical protein Nepgr_011196 [Nepenthes gracilis]|uniref:Uncharacterized protein n=1 Tax=Nepenthes gracilis TaxID=150966 RepID=A0AAD3SES3_NEPGR|nr:hypothetical protein Nepgr_011196 [Nepenthes gracilis]
MIRRKESEGKQAEKQGNFGIAKLERGLLLVRRRGGPTTHATTPVLPWSDNGGDAQHNSLLQATHFSPLVYVPLSDTKISSRKLAAGLWEFLHYFSPLTMEIGVDKHRLRHHQHRHHHHLNKDKGLDQFNLVDPSHASHEPHPANTLSLRRHVAESLAQLHSSAQRNNHVQALLPLSPATDDSSLEMNPYNHAITPTSSIQFNGRIGDSTYRLKTSTKLLKVLNRIWSLEEQHQANVSLVKALKTELNHARAKIKELVQDQRASRDAIDELMKQMDDDELGRKSKEQKKIDAAIQSVRHELEEERKLRRRSESLHRKLAQELFEVKVAASNSLEELEKERRSRQILEELCDEFARGLREYAGQVHTMKPKSDKDWSSLDDHAHLILHLSESWLDERMQVKDGEAQGSCAENNSVVDRLRHEIETFLKTKRNCSPLITEDLLPTDHEPRCLRHHSLESIPVNEASSSPKYVVNEDSAFCDSHCFEINKTGNLYFDSHQCETTGCSPDAKMKSNDVTMLLSSRRKKGRNPSSLQVKFEEQMSWAAALNHQNLTLSTDAGSEGNPPESGVAATAVSVSEGGSLDNPTSRRNTIPIRKWVASVASPELKISGSSSKKLPVSRENTLRAKLQESGPKGPRLKILKGSS